MAGATHPGLVPSGQATDLADAANLLRHGWPAQLAIDPRGFGFALAGLLAQAGGASQFVTLGQGRGGLQMQLYLAFHADPGQVAFRDAPLLADAAPASRERSSPAHQRGFMFRADRIHGTFHARSYGILRSVSQEPFSQAIYSNRFCRASSGAPASQGASWRDFRVHNLGMTLPGNIALRDRPEGHNLSCPLNRENGPLKLKPEQLEKRRSEYGPGTIAGVSWFWYLVRLCAVGCKRGLVANQHEYWGLPQSCVAVQFAAKCLILP